MKCGIENETDNQNYFKQVMAKAILWRRPKEPKEGAAPSHLGVLRVFA